MSVTVKDIRKEYDHGATVALKGVSFDVARGELFGLIGPDGAGKTSLFRILATVLLADSGSATLAGHDVVKDYRQIRSLVGYMPGKFSLYQDLTVKENLEFFATVFGTTPEANYELIRDIYDQIKPFSNRRAGKLSGGMKQKLALCCALIHKPEVLLLDEPTTGVDAVSRKEFWDMLGKLKDQGITILVSTPYMDEADRCERIALIQNGSIMSVNTPRQIRDDFPDKLYAVRSENIYKLLNDLRRHQEVKTCYAFGEFIHVTLKDDRANGEERLERIARACGHRYPVIKNIGASIEDSFIHLMSDTAHKNTTYERQDDQL